MTNKRSAVFFDLDGTWFRWQFFHEVIKQLVAEGLMPQIVMTVAEEALQQYLDRAGSFNEWASTQVNAYQDDGRLCGIRLSDARIAARKVVRSKGSREHIFVRELSNAAHDVGVHRAIISGSMHEAVEAFAEARDIRIFLGTEQPHANGRYTGGVSKEWCWEKDVAIRHLAMMHNLDLASSVAIGDTTSDIGMFENVQWPICFNPSDKLLRVARQKQWPVVIEKKDVNIILKPDHTGRLIETKLNGILPQTLADNLRLRLRDRMWGDQSVTVH